MRDAFRLDEDAIFGLQSAVAPDHVAQRRLPQDGFTQSTLDLRPSESRQSQTDKETIQAVVEQMTGAIINTSTVDKRVALARELRTKPLNIGPEHVESFGGEPHAGFDQPRVQLGVPKPEWGLLANPGFEGKPIAATYFFAGSGNDGGERYTNTNDVACQQVPGVNTSSYTMRPVDLLHLYFSDFPVAREMIVDEIISTGFNVIEMSSWGPRGAAYWARSAPMGTSTCAEDDLFAIANTKNILIIPWIEAFSCEWPALASSKNSFWVDRDFPPANVTSDNPNPTRLRDHIIDLVERYLLPTPTPAWARIYDQQLQPRFAVGLYGLYSSLFSLSNPPTQMELANADALFVQGLDDLAQYVKNKKGIDIGFILGLVDAAPGVETLPVPSWQTRCLPKWQQKVGPLGYAACPERTGPLLAQTASVLGIRQYRSEWKADVTSIESLFLRKRELAVRWMRTGIPVVLDISTGYDGEIVFPDAKLHYGNDDAWRNAQASIRGLVVEDIDGTRRTTVGVAYSAWNGFTEGWAGMEALAWAGKYGDDSGAMAWPDWLRSSLAADPRLPFYDHFVNGAPVPASSGGPYLVYGAIGEKYVAMSGILGPLGAPVSTEKDSFSPDPNSPSGHARRNDFVDGFIFWNSTLGAHEVHGLIAAKYAELGLDGGLLGMPTSDEQPMEGFLGALGGRVSTFEHGSIFWLPSWSSAMVGS